MREENYYILLGIAFDENKISVIEKAIEEKERDWNHTKNAKYLSLIDDIKKVMRDEKLRKIEADAARSIKMKKKGLLLDELHLKALRLGNNANDKDKQKEIKKIWRSYKKYGYSEEECLQLYEQAVKGKTTSECEQIELIGASVAKEIDDLLELLGKQSIYEFLETSSSASIQEINKKASLVEQKNAQKGEKKSTDASENKLCTIIRRIFTSSKEKEKYDNYLGKIKTHADFNQTIDVGIENGVLSYNARQFLVIKGVELNLGRANEVEDYIALYCGFKNYTMEGAIETIVKCELCGTENPQGVSICENCHKPLHIICPSCNTRNGNSAKFCIRCRFEFSKMGEIDKLLHQAKEALINKRTMEAEEYVNKAEVMFPKNPVLGEIKQEVETQKNQIKMLLGELNENIKKKMFYAARRNISDAQISGYTIDTSIVSEVRDTIAFVEREIEKSRALQGDEAFQILLSLSNEIADSLEIKNQLQKYPPSAPSGLRKEKNEKSVCIRWEKSKSCGMIEYRLVRKTGGYPSRVGDGELLYAGRECVYSDLTVPMEQEVFYAAFAVREGVVSDAAMLSESVVLVESIWDLTVKSGDELLNLSWKAKNSVEYVEVGICISEQRPSSEESFIVRQQNLKAIEYCIRNLDNGHSYWVLVTACYIISGKVYKALGIMAQGMPVKPAKPLEEFSIRMQNQKFIASWKMSDGDVELFFSDRKPDYSIGEVYDVFEFENTYARLNTLMLSNTQAEFALDIAGSVYVIPGVVNSAGIILNQALQITNVQPAKDFIIRKERNVLYAEFVWPHRFNRCALAYRKDTYPTGPEDPLAKIIFGNRAAYENDAGLTIIEKPEDGVYYAKLYICCNTEKGICYSEGIKATYKNIAQRNVFYTFNYKKSIIGKKRRLNVTVRCNEKIVFPEFVIVAKKNTIPINRSDGFAVCSCIEQKEMQGEYTFEFEIQNLQTDTKLKMFFLNDECYSSFKIQNSGSNTI